MASEPINAEGMRELALFAGAGGGILGGHLLGWRTVCAVEINDYARRVLMARQDDGCLQPFPIWDDICTFDGRPWRGLVDVISGGFPCQDISVAGKGAGITGARSGLWGEMARIIGEVGPRFVLVENSPALTGRGLGTVLGDLASLGYDARWGVLGAHHAGAPHKRDRIWIVADAGDNRSQKRHVKHCQPNQKREADHALPCRPTVADSSVNGRKPRWEGDASEGEGRWEPGGGREREDLADAMRDHEQGKQSGGAHQEGRAEQDERPAGPCGDELGWWATEPELGRVAHGVANRANRLKAIGNGQVPAVVRLAWETLRS